MRTSGLLPIGIRGGNEEQIRIALQQHIPVYSIHNKVAAEPQKQQTVPEPPANTGRSATLIDHPIRSGQRLYAAGDLIVTAQVSAGAEIMAEGNIHVYNTFSWRVIMMSQPITPVPAVKIWLTMSATSPCKFICKSTP